jgi:hypothetical protein
MVLSLEDRMLMVEQVFYYGDVYTAEVKYKFVRMFLKSDVPHLNIVRQLTDSYKETGSVADVLTSGRPQVLTMDKVLNISDCIMQSPKKLLQQAGILYSSTQRALKIYTCIHAR